MNKQSFEVWMTKVDNEIASRCMGMTSADLPDVCYRDWYDDGVSPKSAAGRAIKSAQE
jgi:hypothetical protein